MSSGYRGIKWKSICYAYYFCPPRTKATRPVQLLGEFSMVLAQLKLLMSSAITVEMDTNLTEEERKKIHEENQSKLKEIHYAIALKDEIIKSLKKELKI